MAIISSPAGFLEILIFLCAVAAFVAAVRFFNDSRRRLNEAFPALRSTRRLFSFDFDRSGFLVPAANEETKRPPRYTTPLPSPAFNQPTDELAELRRQLQHQQRDLTQVWQALTAGGQLLPQPAPTATLPRQAEQQLQDLQARLAAKETEVQQLRQQEAYSQKLQQQFEDVQLAFDNIQEKMRHMERHTRQAAELRAQLEQDALTHNQLEAVLAQKEEKLQTLALENNRLRHTCHELETRLASLGLHHQQLLRKVQLLEGLNADFEEMAEAARKLKTGMARAAEMESMLQAMNPVEQMNR